jgi:hypothetical protein
VRRIDRDCTDRGFTCGWGPVPNDDIWAKVRPVWPDEGSRFHAHALEGGAVTTDGIEDWAYEQIRQIPLDGCAVRQGEPDAESIEHNDLVDAD